MICSFVVSHFSFEYTILIDCVSSLSVPNHCLPFTCQQRHNARGATLDDFSGHFFRICEIIIFLLCCFYM